MARSSGVKSVPLARKTVRLVLTRNLIKLERGRDELILANTCELNPLYVRSGRAYVEKVVAAAEELKTRARLEQAFPGDGALIRALVRHRILVPEKADQNGRDQAPASTRELPPGPSKGITLYLVMSQACNLRCVYCFNGERTYQKGHRRLMTPETAAAAVKRSLELLDPTGRLQIAFFGGEPLLNWTGIKQTIETCERRLKPRHPQVQIQYHITTNLTRLPADLGEWARKYNITFLVNLDGTARIHDRLRPFRNGRPSHDLTADHVAKLRQAGIPVYLRSTVTALNQDRMIAVVRHHRQIGGVSTALVPLSPVTSDEEYLPESMLPSPDRLIAGLEEVYAAGIWPSDKIFPFTTYAGKVRPGSMMVFGCGAPYGNIFAVQADGSMFPCSSLAGIQRFYLGNVHDPKAPDRRVLAGMMKRLHVDLDPECRDCAWRYLCGGGCPVWKLLALDDPKCPPRIKDYLWAVNCRFTQKVLELLLWEMADEAAQQVSERRADAAEPALDRTIYC